MGFEDLNVLLNKECIIGTYTAGELLVDPGLVERVYETYARTHIALGDTATYVSTMKQYLTGTFKKAFIGSVVGEFGHGKTSFLVHVWHECSAQKILCIPPFKMDRIARCMQTVSEWVAYALREEHADLSEQALALGREYKDANLEETARKYAQDKDQDYDTVLGILREMVETGRLTLDFEHRPGDFLDFLNRMTVIVQQAGWKGLLVLVDEPQHAASLPGMSVGIVLNLIFDWADGMLHREGNYGIFLAMPENFYAKAVTQFAAVVARLQQCSCLVRLKELYGQSFARDLWERYSKEFRLGKDAVRVVPDYTLEAIGQVGSSERTDLSYGPRTVVSAFKQMVYHFTQTNQPYQPSDFVVDCLNKAIFVMPEYTTRVQQALDAVEAHQVSRDTLLTLAAFPNGLTDDNAATLGILEDVAILAQAREYAYHKGKISGLDALRRSGTTTEKDELKERLVDIADTFSPSPATFRNVRTAFIESILPRLFIDRKGRGLLGWSSPKADDWRPLGGSTVVGEYEGSFEQTVQVFPRRTVLVTVGDQADNADGKYKKAIDIKDTKSFADIIIQFCLRWDPESVEAPQPVLLDVGENTTEHRRAARIALFLDLTGSDGDDNPAAVYPETAELFQTAFGTLYAIAIIEKEPLQRDAAAAWFPLKEQAIRWLVQRILGSSELRTQAEQLSGHQMPGDAIALLGSLARSILLAEYQDYHTLIRQVEWEKRLDDYINALKNVDVPMPCKRGRECWTVPSGTAASTFRTNALSLNDYFIGFEELVEIRPSSTKPKYADIQFHVHPHEKHIMEMVSSVSSGQRRQIQGKLCSWVRYADVKRALIFAGYCELEILKLIEIGRSRGTFEATADDGESILYCRPLDPVQMKALLTGLLDEFQNVQEQFLKLPGTTILAETGVLRKKLDVAKAEEEYDTIQITLRAARQSLEVSIPFLYGSFKTRANPVLVHFHELKAAIAQEPLVHLVTIKQKASSGWVSALNGFVAIALTGKIENLRDRLQHAAETVSSLEKVEAVAIPDAAESQIAALQKAETTLGELRQDESQLDTDWKQMLSYLREYEAWLKLLARSDGLSDQLLEMKKDSNHKQRATELLTAFRKVSDEIDTHLRTHNVLGLQAHGQYEARLDEIDKNRHDYLGSLRTAFERRKATLVELMTSLAETDDFRPRATFDPEDSSGSHARLEEEALDGVRLAVKSELSEAKYNEQELHYACDVLNTVSEADAKRLDDKLQDAKGRVDRMLSGASLKWLDHVVSSPELSTAAAADVDFARKVNREARKSILSWGKPAGERPEPSRDAQDVLKQLNASEQLDLKELVLQLMGQGAKPKDALEIALKGLVELFRQLRVNVQIKAIDPSESDHHASGRSK